MTDNTEFEVLFYPVNHGLLRQKLISLKATKSTDSQLFRKVIFDGRTNPAFTCHFIRVRDEGKLVRLSAKTHASAAGKISDKKETDVTVSDFDKTIEILKAAGLKPDQYLESRRETWLLDESEIGLDMWPGLEDHIEIEAHSEAQVHDVAVKLGFDWSKRIISSRVEIYAQIYGLTNDQVLDKFAKLTFENNPFANLPKVGTI